MNELATSPAIIWSQGNEAQTILSSIDWGNYSVLQQQLHQLMRHPQFRFIADWALGLHKLKEKVPYFWENRFLATKLSVEQCSRWETALAKSAGYSGKRFLDLTAGIGVDSFAFSKQFEQAVAVEENVLLHQFQTINFKKISRQNIEPVLSTAEGFLAAQMPNSTFDLVYIDPSRRDFASGKRAFLLQHITPNILALIPHLQSITNKVLVKLSPLFDISEALRGIPFLSEVQVVSWEGECKELLALLDFSNRLPPKVCAKVLTKIQQFEYQLDKKSPEIPILLGGDFLYLADAAIRKAGLFQEAFRAHFSTGSGTTHPKSGIFISDNQLLEFPGRVYQLIDKFPFQKKTLKQFLQQNPLQNNYTLISVFYPHPVEPIKQEFKLLDSNQHFLLLTETVSGAAIYVLRRLS